jgi:hypothetical protein
MREKPDIRISLGDKLEPNPQYPYRRSANSKNRFWLFRFRWVRMECWVEYIPTNPDLSREGSVG